MDICIIKLQIEVFEISVIWKGNFQPKGNGEWFTVQGFNFNRTWQIHRIPLRQSVQINGRKGPGWGGGVRWERDQIIAIDPCEICSAWIAHQS